MTTASRTGRRTFHGSWEETVTRLERERDEATAEARVYRGRLTDAIIGREAAREREARLRDKAKRLRGVRWEVRYESPGRPCIDPFCRPTAAWQHVRWLRERGYTVIAVGRVTTYARPK